MSQRQRSRSADREKNQTFEILVTSSFLRTHAPNPEDIIKTEHGEVLRDVFVCPSKLSSYFGIPSSQVQEHYLNQGRPSLLKVTLRCPHNVPDGGRSRAAACSGAVNAAHGRSRSPTLDHGRSGSHAIDGYAKKTASDGSVYEGEFLAGKPHGLGKKVHPDGHSGSSLSYEGEYRNGRRHGKGKAVFRDGGCFEGEWVNNKQHGFGKKVFADGRSYEGEYRNGRRHGKGKEILSQSESFDKVSAEGASVRCYEGEWEDGSWCGAGRLLMSDGSLFDAVFFQHEPVRGRWISPGGVLDYEGEFKSMKPYGKGKMTLNVCPSKVCKSHFRSYEGYFDGVRFHGRGSLLFYSGTRLEGEFVDSRAISGRMSFADGSCYEGEFRDLKFHGCGAITYAPRNFHQIIIVTSCSDTQLTARHLCLASSTFGTKATSTCCNIIEIQCFVAKFMA